MPKGGSTPPVVVSEEAKVDRQANAAAASESEGAPKYKKRKMKKKRQQEQQASQLYSGSAVAAPVEGEAKGKGMDKQEATNAGASDLYLDVTLKQKKKKKKKNKGEQRGIEEQEATTLAVSAVDGTPKCGNKMKKKRQQEQKESHPESGPAVVATVEEVAKGRTTEEQEAANTGSSGLSLEGTPKRKRRKQDANMKDNGIEEQEDTTHAVSALEGIPKRKKKQETAKLKEREIADKEADALIVSASEGTPKCKEELKMDLGMPEQGVTSSTISALEQTPKCKKKMKKKSQQKQQECVPDSDPAVATPVVLKGRCIQEREAASAGASGLSLEKTPKRKKMKEEDAKVKEKGVGEQEATTLAVSAQEGTPKFKKKKMMKKKKIQEQKESRQALLDAAALDKSVMESRSGCTDEEGASGVADVWKDLVNREESSCQSKENDADALVENKNVNGFRDCFENCGSLQESLVGRKRRKRKKKHVSSSEGSTLNGDRVVKHRSDSTDDDPSSIPGSFSVQEAHKEKIKNIYSPRGSLIRFQRKKLLILDLNGLLADINQDYHNAHLAHAKVRAKLVFKRPYCEEFLRFCFEHFELGIWSSRKRENVKSVVDILMSDLKQYLLFCWDMSNCTFTGRNTVENNYKPLVLKELKKLWNKEDPNLPWEQGEFSPSNTLLVDDSPYKALCNPPNTAIFPYPYSYLNQREDKSLGPSGDLRVYLERLAAADDVQAFVQDNPFGQPSITESDPHWNFYVQIVNKTQKKSLA